MRLLRPRTLLTALALALPLAVLLPAAVLICHRNAASPRVVELIVIVPVAVAVKRKKSASLRLLSMPLKAAPLAAPTQVVAVAVLLPNSSAGISASSARCRFSRL